MSKFFKGAISSSDSSDTDESEVEVPVHRAPIGRDFAYPSDSEDEGPKRVVRAQKDKMYSELKEQIRLGRNARNIKDMSKLLSAFENLGKSYEKTKSVIARENLTTPRFFIRFLVELENFINEQWEDKEARKSMSKANSKSLTSLRQKMKKYVKDFEADISEYREGPDPIGYSSGAAEDDEDEPEIEAVKAPALAEKKLSKEKPVKKVVDLSGSESEDESIWGTDSDEASSESDIDLEGKAMEELRRFFLKKDPNEVKKKKYREVKKPKESGKEKIVDDDKWTLVAPQEKMLFPPNAEITHEVFLKKLLEIGRDRGRKSTNRKQYVKHLQDMYKIADEQNLGPGVLAKILLAVISALFEVNTKLSEAMPFNQWMKTLETISGLFELLNENRNVRIMMVTKEDEENLSNSKELYVMHGSMILLVKRLDDELTKIFQLADCHSTDYIEKLKGEKEICLLIEKAQNYVESNQRTIFDQSEILTIYLLRIEHFYYKYSSNDEESAELMDRLCLIIYADKTAKLQRQRAMLCQIYHHALHDRWHQAKDLMLMSHLQAIVDHSEASTQILYNRTICQLGLCAFRHGFIKEAHLSLSEIQNTQRAKELLAQGIPPRQMDKTAEQESKERNNQVPYHMHINLELMECVYLICSMLLEIPNIASHEYDLRRRLLSRSFHYQLKLSEKSPLIGPPENTREHVVAASRAMLKGDWKKCVEYIINEKMNAKVWNLFRNSEKVKEMVVKRIQEETLRTYLLMYSTIYTTVSLDTLREMFSDDDNKQFELNMQKVYSIISKMIIQEELNATLDEPTNCLIVHRIEPTRLQILALNLTDKLSQLADTNENIVEPRGPRAGYTGPGNWYIQRQERSGTEDKKKGGGIFQAKPMGERRMDQSKRAWGGAGQRQQTQRRENKPRF